ncbi:hypothetical protein GALMADRAFT_1333804 [Galerina marginata CBS 339.88]|uniref:Uncharacterized protein n=1 Tax=Galerina marginata (strain CBS 339.88) TaxID=685588 RepID=A0A067SWV3_GALM3|nr:hypothetical protein GALMADRAFT_1333804 [Galerina marginata CBS 339.88]
MMMGETVELKNEIERLEEVHGRLQRVRQIPRVLLQMKGNEKVGDEFGVVKEIGELVQSAAVQAALSRAQESLKADAGGLGTEHRRLKRKKSKKGETSRRTRSPEGYVAEERKGTTVLPVCSEDAVKMEQLGAWARAYNAAHKNKIRIRGDMVRLAIPDVMTVYMGVGRGEGDRVVVETIRAFGPREQMEGHGQSGYTVYQELSQQMNKMLEMAGQAKLQQAVGLVEAYEDVFVGRCAVCGRVVAGEGHVPGVVRRWTGSGWAGEHIGCSP